MIKPRKKILFFIATLFQGGAERLISDLSFAFEDFEVVIVISENKVSYPYKGKLIVLGVPFPQNPVLKVYNYFVRFIKLRKVVVEEKPDYVVSFGAFANVFNVFLPSKVILHTDSFYSMRNDAWGVLLKLFARFFYNRAETVVPMSFCAASDLAENYGVLKEKLRVIYNPLNLERIRKMTDEPLGEDEQEVFSHPVVVTAGRLTEQKGHGHVVSAFKKFKEFAPDAKLVILGEGEYERDLRELARTLGVEKDIHFLGWQDNPFRYFKKADMFVFASHWEGLPAALLEALACGVPVISADCKSGPREILAPSSDILKQTKEMELAEFGVLVPTMSPETAFTEDLTLEESNLAYAMALLYRDLSWKKRLSQKGQKRAEDFDIKRILKDWKLLFGYDTLGNTKP
ncbi:MAG: glycosyltransferase [bacterium]|nr:glycosyltransferase [bacterium]